MSTAMVRDLVRGAAKALVPSHREFADIRFSPHDFRRLLATGLVNNGLPIHIGAALMGHLDVQTTRGYVAVFDEDVVRHYQEFLDRRRAQRPASEYHEDRVFEGAIARPGVLKVNDPDLGAVPQEVGKVGVSLSQNHIAAVEAVERAAGEPARACLPGPAHERAVIDRVVRGQYSGYTACQL